jgi:DNA-binding IscR family transcriptional regulator
VFLARPVNKISVYDVISAIDGEAFFTTCFMGIDGCGKIEPCPFHGFWSMYREQIKEWLQQTTFAQAEELMSNAWFEERLTFTSNNAAAG